MRCSRPAASRARIAASSTTRSTGCRPKRSPRCRISPSDRSCSRESPSPCTAREGAGERIIPIDFLPRLIAAAEWDFIERGLTQRLKALNLFLADVYGAGRILADGAVPAALVRGCPQYRIEMRGVEAPHGVHVALCGTDLVRTNDGFMVLEDNLRVPSGVSYMLANRRALKSSLRDLYRRHRVRGIGHYGQLLRKTLAELAPRGNSDPCIVLLTPGVHNSAFYEHMFLAQEMGRGTGAKQRPRCASGFRAYADHRRAEAGRCDLPAHRRRFHRPAGVSSRFADRRARGCSTPTA